MPHRVARDEVFLIGPDDQYGNPRGIGTDHAFAICIPSGVENGTGPTATIDHLGSCGSIVFTNAP
jgi:hypothetical protein